MAFDPERLRSCLAAVPDSTWSLPSSFAATGVHQGYSRAVLVEAGRYTPAGDLFGFVLDEFGPVWSAGAAAVEPGGFIVPHCDAGPHRERWHVPIEPAGATCGVEAVAGVPFPVEHWEPHDVINDTDRRRVHLVIDRDVIVRPDPTPFLIQPKEPR